MHNKMYNRSAYQIFVKSRMQSRDIAVSVPEVMKAAATQWNNMGVSERREFTEAATRARTEYKTNLDKVRAQQDLPPSAPITAFLRYVRGNYAFSGKETRETLSEAAESWRSMSPYERQEYYDDYSIARAEHDTDMVAWRGRVGTENLDAMEKIRQAHPIVRASTVYKRALETGEGVAADWDSSLAWTDVTDEAVISWCKRRAKSLNRKAKARRLAAFEAAGLLAYVKI